MDPEAPRPFFRAAAVAFALVIGAAGSLSYIVDPYRLLHEWVIPGVTESKPAAGDRGQVIKPILVERAHAKGLILGASREDVGLDPRHPAWPTRHRPVFNLAVPGSRPSAQIRYLLHAAAVSPPSLVVMSLDYLSFLEVVDEDEPLTSLEPNDALRVGLEGEPNPSFRRRRLWELYSALLSIDALADSIRTLVSQSGYASIDDLGFSSGEERFLPEIAAKGQHSVVRDVVRGQAEHLARLVAADAKPATYRRQLAVLDRLFAYAEANAAEVRLFIPPSHAYELENLRERGLWDDVESWKLDLVAAVERANRTRALAAPIRLTDFSGYDAVTTEPVPPPGDTRTIMRWYWEPIHYRTELGGRIVESLFAPDATAPLGADLDAASVCAHLVRTRLERDRYAATERSARAAVGLGTPDVREGPAWAHRPRRCELGEPNTTR